MPRPYKSIKFYCHCCETHYMGEQKQTMQWDKTRVNFKRCSSCNNKLFHGVYMRGVETDFAMETTNSLKGARY